VDLANLQTEYVPPYSEYRNACTGRCCQFLGPAKAAASTGTLRIWASRPAFARSPANDRWSSELLWRPRNGATVVRGRRGGAAGIDPHREDSRARVLRGSARGYGSTSGGNGNFRKIFAEMSSAASSTGIRSWHRVRRSGLSWCPVPAGCRDGIRFVSDLMSYVPKHRPSDYCTSTAPPPSGTMPRH